MNSKQRVLNAIFCKDIDRIPWVPFVGCHAARLIGVNAEEYFKSEDHIVNGILKADEEYRPRRAPCAF